jgi:hypothetical protein
MRNLYKCKHYEGIRWASLALMVVLFGCYTPEKAIKQTDKALANYPEKIAPKIREAFPCTLEKIDTVHDWQNSTVWIDCPPQTPLVVTDTFYKTSLKSTPVPIKIERITVTKVIKDSAEIYALKDTIAALKVSLVNCKNGLANIERESASVQKKYENPLYLLVALIFSVVAYFFQLRKSKAKAK